MVDNFRTLDWVSQHDSRSKNFPVRSIVPFFAKKVPTFWTEGVVLDQGREGACVGYGWTAELLAEPFAPVQQPLVASAESYATLAYRRAKLVDDFPGEDYSGTSVLAGAKIMQEDGHIERYRWCFGVSDVRDTILTLGPVVIGIPWYESMYSVGADHVVSIGGDLVGGHCLIVTGYHPEFVIDGKREQVFRWRNSWGASYGHDGSAYIKYSDLAALLRGGGEACIPEGRRTPSFDVPLD